MSSVPGEIEKNLDRMKSFVQEASERGVHILCFPELSITGYTLSNPGDIYSGSTAQKIIERVKGMARESGMIVIAGMIEVFQGERPYISQVVAGPEGLAGFYRKTHLSPPEKGKYRPGQKIDVFSIGHIRFGVQLCYESHFPEISTLMALKGVDIIFIPHASPRGTPEEKMKSWLRHLPGRAFDNGIFVVACNQVGKTDEGLSFPGGALAIGPTGQVIVSYCGNEDRMLVADLRMEELRAVREHRMRYFVPKGRPELYGELVIPRK